MANITKRIIEVFHRIDGTKEYKAQGYSENNILLKEKIIDVSEVDSLIKLDGFRIDDVWEVDQNKEPQAH